MLEVCLSVSEGTMCESDARVQLFFHTEHVTAHHGISSQIISLVFAKLIKQYSDKHKGTCINIQTFGVSKLFI